MSNDGLVYIRKKKKTLGNVGPVAQSVQRLATGCTVRGWNPGGSEVFLTCPDRPWGPPSLLYNGYRFFPGGKQRPGRDADPSPPSSAVLMKGQSYTSTPPIGRTACTVPQCLYRGALYILPFRKIIKKYFIMILASHLPKTAIVRISAFYSRFIRIRTEK